MVEYLSFTGQDEIGVEDLPPTFIKIKDTDMRHGAGGLMRGWLTENGNKWKMECGWRRKSGQWDSDWRNTGRWSPSQRNTGRRAQAGGIPAGNTMDDQYPNGEYLNGQYPDGQYPNGQYPDGFWFVLEQLYLASEQDELIGRERILKTAKSNYILIPKGNTGHTELHGMQWDSQGKQGRGGSRITLTGRNKWEEYKEMTN